MNNRPDNGLEILVSTVSIAHLNPNDQRIREEDARITIQVLILRPILEAIDLHRKIVGRELLNGSEQTTEEVTEPVCVLSHDSTPESDHEVAAA